MSDTLSSDEATEQGEQEYKSLEEYIFETQRDMDNEMGKSLRLRSWQELQLRYIKNRINTNAVEVMVRSYSMGLRELRSEYGEEPDELSDILSKMVEVIHKDPRNRGAIDDISDDIMNYSSDISEPSGGQLSEPKRYRFRESEVSEVENTYIDDAFFGGWIHRYVATLGFLNSEFLQNDPEQRLSSFMASLSESFEQTRDEIESMAVDFLGVSITYWTTNGLSKELHEEWKELAEMLSDERQQKCEEILDMAEKYIEE